MTVWGLSPFDDDDTIDFAYEIKRTGLVALARACRDARYSDSRPEQHAEGFAAAYTIAAIITQDAEAISAETLKFKPTPELIDSAGAALRVIRELGGEYLARWSEIDEEVLKLKAQQFNIMAQALGFDSEEPLRPSDLLLGRAPEENDELEVGTWQHQRAMNLHLLNTRNQMKDDFEKEREVDHSFACSSEQIALAVVKELSADYQIDGPNYLEGRDGEEDCWEVVATKVYAPDFENTWGHTLRMFDVAYKTRAEYDGWGAPVEKRKKSWFGR